MGLTLGLLFGLAFGLVINPTFELAFGLDINPTFGLTYGLLYTACGFIIYEFFREDIKLVDTLKWSWQKALKNSWLTLIFVPILVVTNELAFGVIFGLLLWLILGWEKQTKISKTTRPNQGIWKSVRNTIKVAVIIGLVSGSFLVVSHNLIPDTLIPDTSIAEVDSLVFGLANGIMFGYAAALLSTQGAGFVGLKHLMLRFLFWLSGCIPWNYARFLDYASERLLMKKVGGGYIFYHRMLMEHFAQRHQISRKSIPVASRQTSKPVVEARTTTTVRSRNARVPQRANLKSNHIVCSNCRHQNPTTGKFCTKCGNKLIKSY